MNNHIETKFLVEIGEIINSKKSAEEKLTQISIIYKNWVYESLVTKNFDPRN